jgi:hypothetical protein
VHTIQSGPGPLDDDSSLLSKVQGQGQRIAVNPAHPFVLQSVKAIEKRIATRRRGETDGELCDWHCLCFKFLASDERHKF